MPGPSHGTKGPGAKKACVRWTACGPPGSRWNATGDLVLEGTGSGARRPVGLSRKAHVRSARLSEVLLGAVLGIGGIWLASALPATGERRLIPLK